MKKYRFWFHYNKNVSKKLQKPTITIHYRSKCLIVDNLIIDTKTWGKINKTQPFFVVCGDAQNIIIQDNVAHIL